MALQGSFAGKVITVTGAARGIGLATARYLAARGANVSMADIRKDELVRAQESILKELPSVSVVYAVVDVSNKDEVDKWIRSTKNTFGRIDGCVNNAGEPPISLHMNADTEGCTRLFYPRKATART